MAKVKRKGDSIVTIETKNKFKLVINNPEEAIYTLMDLLTGAERISIANSFCKGCGVWNKPGERECMCNRDE